MTQYYDDLIVVTQLTETIYNGTRREFKDLYFSNCTDYAIEGWCKECGYSLTINNIEIKIE